MENIEFGKQLEERTKKFAIIIIRFSASLPQTKEFIVIKNQLTKSGTSIGANYREANLSRSKPDFRNKIKICESEASETLYWLEIIGELKVPDPVIFKKVLGEVKEILALFTKIGKSLSKQ